MEINTGLELLDKSTVLIIFAKPRAGKTVLMTHLANMAMYDFNRIERMQLEVEKLNREGFNLEIPPHCVSANYDITGFQYGFSMQKNRKINPYKLGYKEGNAFDKDLHLNIPHEVIAITEAQRYLNSRRSANFPDWQSRWYESLGHNGITVMLDTQRPTLIDKNVRELSIFIEIRELLINKDKYGSIQGLRWKIREIPSNEALEVYLASGRNNKECYEEGIITANYNVFECYDTHSCRERFYKGREMESFCFTADVEDELPKWFYKSGQNQDKEKQSS